MRDAFKAVAGAAIIATLCAAQVASSQPMSRQEIEQAIGQYKSYTPKDEFSPPFPVATYVGRTFRIEGSFRSGKSTGPTGDAMGFYSYDVAAQSLKLVLIGPIFLDLNRLDPPYSGEYLDRPEAEGFHFKETSAKGPAYVGQNSFGAKALVGSEHHTSLGIVQFGKGRGVGLPARDGYSYEKAISASPEEARALSQNARVIVTGRITEYLPGRAFGCSRRFRAATIDQPTDLTFEDCFAAVRIDMIEFTDTASGATVASWSSLESR